MRDFPFELCPSASELLAYVRGVAGGDDAGTLFERVSTHLVECTDCREAVERLRTSDIETASRNVATAEHPSHTIELRGQREDHAGQGSTRPRTSGRPKDTSGRLSRQVTPDVSAMLDAFDDLLTRQRSHLARMRASTSREPVVGEVWTSYAPWGTGKSAISALFVVLRTFFEEWTAEPLIDLAPVTDDEWLAADWTLVLDVEHSGTGTPLALHLDLQCTARRHVLRRWVGRLPDAAGADLMTVLHAFERGEAPPADALRVGRLGQAAVRTRPEWSDFSRQLFSVCAAVGIGPEDETAAECGRPDEQARSTPARAAPRDRVDRDAAVPVACDVDRHPARSRPLSSPGERERPSPRMGSATDPRANSLRESPADPRTPVEPQGGGTGTPGAGSPTSPYTPPVAQGPDAQSVASGRASDSAAGSPPCSAVPGRATAQGSITIRFEGNLAEVLATLGDVFRWYLAQECEGDLRRWCLLRGRRIAWHLLKSYEVLPAQVALHPDQLPAQLRHAAGAPDVDTLFFVKEAAQRVRGIHDLAGQQIGQRAARSTK